MIKNLFTFLKKLFKGTELLLKGVTRPASLRPKIERISATFLKKKEEKKKG